MLGHSGFGWFNGATERHRQKVPILMVARRIRRHRRFYQAHYLLLHTSQRLFHGDTPAWMELCILKTRHSQFWCAVTLYEITDWHSATYTSVRSTSCYSTCCASILAKYSPDHVARAEACQHVKQCGYKIDGLRQSTNKHLQNVIEYTSNIDRLNKSETQTNFVEDPLTGTTL